ncbi:Fe-S cluster assembly protein DRE2 [Colletotrichum siamense]|nr:Fe-S cluster assembly protein DRE2 [Colletotrichum siamense]
MAPSIITLDTTPDFDFTPSALPPSAAAPAATPKQQQRTLLLAPPSLSSAPNKLSAALASHDRAATDLQMLDRLSARLVSLPESAYDLVLVLTDADGSRVESTRLLSDRAVLSAVAEALKPAARLRAQDGGNLANDPAVAREAVLAGLVAVAGGFEKPDYDEAPVTLSFGKKKTAANGNGAVSLNGGAVSLNGGGAVSLNSNGAVSLSSKPSTAPAVSAPPGVGFVDFSDDLDMDDDDDELIDEDALLTDADLSRPLNIRTFHPPNPQKTSTIKKMFLTNTTLTQPPNAPPRPENAAAPAKTAPAAWQSASPPKTPSPVPPPTQPSQLPPPPRPSSSTRTTSLRSTSPSRAKSAPVATAPSATPSAATAAPTSACPPSSPARRCASSTTISNCNAKLSLYHEILFYWEWHITGSFNHFFWHKSDTGHTKASGTYIPLQQLVHTCIFWIGGKGISAGEYHGRRQMPDWALLIRKKIVLRCLRRMKNTGQRYI